MHIIIVVTANWVELITIWKLVLHFVLYTVIFTMYRAYIVTHDTIIIQFVILNV